MSDNGSPSKNPFIRFKQHVDSHIGSGLSVLTGGSKKAETATTTEPKSELPRPPNSIMGTGAPKPPAQSSWIDSILGRSHDPRAHNASRIYWEAWALESLYSPYNLTQLEPPTPAGVSPNDAHLLGFEDAFEDLLAITQGQKMMDLRKQARCKRRNWDRNGEPAYLWVHRLSSRGLLPPPLPPSTSAGVDPKNMTYDVHNSLTGQESEILKSIQAQQEERLRTKERQQKEIEQVIPSTKAMIDYLMGASEAMLKGLDQDVTFNPAKMLRQVELLAKHLDKELGGLDPSQLLRDAAEIRQGLDRALEKLDAAKQDCQVEESKKDFGVKGWTDVKSDTLWAKFAQGIEGHWANSSNPAPKTQYQQKPQPETEEDLFSTIFGALLESNAATITPTNSVKESPVAPVVRTSEEANEHGGKTLRYSSLTTERSGLVQEQNVAVTYDAQGNVVSHEEKFFHRFPAPLEVRHGHADYFRQAWTNAARDESGRQLALSEQESKRQNKQRCVGVLQEQEQQQRSQRGSTQKLQEERSGKSGKSSGWFWT